jgi:hypothetical protein
MITCCEVGMNVVFTGNTRSARRGSEPADSGMGVVVIRPSKHIQERSAVNGTMSNIIY